MVAQSRDRETDHGQSRDGPNREIAHNNHTPRTHRLPKIQPKRFCGFFMAIIYSRQFQVDLTCPRTNELHTLTSTVNNFAVPTFTPSRKNNS